MGAYKYKLYPILIKQQQMQENKVIQQWNMLADLYNDIEPCVQIYYYTLLNLLELKEKSAKKILEVGCGNFGLITTAIQYKNPESHYLATDLTPKMLEIGKKRLQERFAKYESKITWQEWLKKNNVEIKAADGSKPFLDEDNKPLKFDRIFANMVLMLAEDPEQFLKNLYEHAQPGCLLGVSIWGDDQKNNFHTIIPKLLKQVGVEIGKGSNFKIYKKVAEMASKIGWQVVRNWEQDSAINITRKEQCMPFGKLVTGAMKDQLTEEQRNHVYEEFVSQVGATLETTKTLNFPAELLILRKPK